MKASDILYLIEEEDLTVVENKYYSDDFLNEYEAEYLDNKVAFIVFKDEELLEKEIQKRIQLSSFYFPSLLGLSLTSGL